jgi:hypothetical protein
MVRKCLLCTKSQVYKDAEWCIAFIEATGKEEAASAEDIILVNLDTPSTPNDK